MEPLEPKILEEKSLDEENEGSEYDNFKLAENV